MKVAISHPFGNPHVYNAALALFERNILSEYHTCLFGPLGSKYRRFAKLRGAAIRAHPLREVVRLGLCLIGPGLLSGRRQPWIDWVARGLDKAVARELNAGVQAVYCYEDAAVATFEEAKQKGVRTFYELTSGYQDEAKAVAAQEVMQDPSLSRFCPSLDEREEKQVRKRREVLLADHIICASSYSMSTLKKYMEVAGKVSVLPYGCDCDCAVRNWSRLDHAGPLKLLFVGRLAPMKGLHYLFGALEKFRPGSFELTLAGRWAPEFREWLLRRYRVQFRETGHVSRVAVIELMRQNHLLVFPSLFEGFGLVMLEAMSVGLPVLATERTGAPDIIRDGQEGFLASAASREDIARVLSRVLDDRKQLADMGAAARNQAMSQSWEQYRRRLYVLVASHLGLATLEESH